MESQDLRLEFIHRLSEFDKLITVTVYSHVRGPKNARKVIYILCQNVIRAQYYKYPCTAQHPAR